MEKVFFVSLHLYDATQELSSVKSIVVHDAKTDYEAMGKAVSTLFIGPYTMIQGYDIVEHVSVDLDDSRLAHALSLSQESFLSLLQISSDSIMRCIHRMLEEEGGMKNRIPAIKYLREHLKPHLGLKDCKEIVDIWVSDINHHRDKTHLVKMVVGRLKAK